MPNNFYGFSFLFGMCGAMVVSLVIHFFQPPIISMDTVNITGLVEQFIQEEAKKNLTDAALREAVKRYGQQLDAVLKDFSEKNHVVLLPSEAVIAGSHDKTRDIAEAMHHGMR